MGTSVQIHRLVLLLPAAIFSSSIENVRSSQPHLSRRQERLGSLETPTDEGMMKRQRKKKDEARGEKKKKKRRNSNKEKIAEREIDTFFYQ